MKGILDTTEEQAVKSLPRYYYIVVAIISILYILLSIDSPEPFHKLLVLLSSSEAAQYYSIPELFFMIYQCVALPLAIILLWLRQKAGWYLMVTMLSYMISMVILSFVAQTLLGFDITLDPMLGLVFSLIALLLTGTLTTKGIRNYFDIPLSSFYTALSTGLTLAALIVGLIHSRGF